MKYSEITGCSFPELRTSKDPVHIPGTSSEIIRYHFSSNASHILPSTEEKGYKHLHRYFPSEDSGIAENRDFSYYVLKPSGKSEFRKSIFLLHGLNEKSWKKYWSWALILSENTGLPVILFPFAFHMDRAPSIWSHSRLMQQLSQYRNGKQESNSDSSFVNAAISERLDNSPMRFYLSGYQTASDLHILMKNIRQGLHPLFHSDSVINLFGYSIGAFLAQIMLIADKDDIFKDSRCFLFAGGSVFEDMNGQSKLIMDSRAFAHVLHYFINDLESCISKSDRYTKILKETELGLAFRAMIGRTHNCAIRDSVFHYYGKRICAIGLKKDKVIPAASIRSTVKGKNGHIQSEYETIDFPYEYTHENPFPLEKVQDCEVLDRSFQTIFDKASDFLN